MTVIRGGQTLWRFLAVRPAASSGTNGSGVELRFVDHKGKRVLYRAHVPILNVYYDANACGPYRDWQYQEGTIRPRFGFTAVESQCVCNVHHHHLYWRLDFDIRTSTNNFTREFNDPPLIGSSKWHTKSFEIRRPRDFTRKRKWRVENTVSGEGYEIVPNAGDGVASTEADAPFGRGHVWILRYRSSEIDAG